MIFGSDRAREVLNPALRDYVTGAIETQCVYQLTSTLGTPAAGFTPPNTLGEMVDAAFATEVVDCVKGSCTDRASTYVAFVEGNTAPIDESTAKILLVGGSLDAQQPPARQACPRDTLEAAGVPYEVCQFTDKTHFDIVPSAIGFAIQWVRDDTTPCPGTATLPDCANLAP